MIIEQLVRQAMETKLFKKLRKVFHSRRKQRRQFFEEWQRSRPSPQFASVRLTIEDTVVPFIPAVGLAETPIPESMPAVPGDKLHKYNWANRPNYRPITLVPALPTTDSFPWLADDSWINSSQPSAVYEPPEPETKHDLEAVRKIHERK